MRIKVHNGLQRPQVLEASSVVIEDDHGNVLFAGQQQDPHNIIYTWLGDKDYQQVLRMLGIHKRLVIQDIPEKPLSNVIWTP